MHRIRFSSPATMMSSEESVVVLSTVHCVKVKLVPLTSVTGGRMLLAALPVLPYKSVDSINTHEL